MSRILVIDDDLNLLQMVKLMLERVGHEVQIANEGERGIVAAGQTQPDLAIIDVMMPGLSGYDVVRRLRKDPLTAHIPIIILTARSQPMDKAMALEAGANAFLSKPVTAQELIDRVDAVIRAGVNYRVHTGLLTEPIPPGTFDVQRPTGALPGSPATAPQGQPAPPAPPPTRRMPIGAEQVAPASSPAPTRLPVTTVISLRGGTGCTTIAVNLALALATAKRRVCLADLSAAGGHIQLHLHMKPNHTWEDLIGDSDVPDAETIANVLSHHEASGLTLLAAPARPQELTLSSGATTGIMQNLTATYDPVIVDARYLDPATRGALQVSSTVVVVMTDDPPSVQTAGQLLATLDAMNIEPSRIHVVLNHVRPTFDVPTDAIQKALKRPIAVNVPYDPNQPNAIRRGVPMVNFKPDSQFTQSIKQLVQAIT